MPSADRTPFRTFRRPIPLLLPALLTVALGLGGCSTDSGSAGDGKPRKSGTTTSDPIPPAFLAALRQETKCMREHGIADYPDPSPTNGEFTYPAALGEKLKLDPATAAIWHTCQAKSGGDGIQGG
ncbi:hypothetical protein [Streptomyces sp. H39-S7]|uniref:hypothetical protein n=1 Tax=Streptomyces sp. H39-S7 TaxID=3004357 RepID=UPI0022B025D3|nr:hypothetical protein [Streptomyces sp. H39-S7]MCZ4122211.1 hypothetical protein [Streptomyces sp. H39-S7]